MVECRDRDPLKILFEKKGNILILLNSHKNTKHERERPGHHKRNRNISHSPQYVGGYIFTAANLPRACGRYDAGAGRVSCKSIGKRLPLYESLVPMRVIIRGEVGNL